ncbi:DUF427 domain-containing protein [Eoetvoesiella caeni]
MPRAIWNGVVIAEASQDEIEMVEGNVYFPLSSVHHEYLQSSDKVTQCHWKGSANYYDVVVNGQTNRDAAWTYRQPLDAAKKIANHIAFWRGIEIER